VKQAKAFAPAAISSFFEICDSTPSGNPITDLEKIGARGGGFGLQKGVLTEVTVSEAEKPSTQVYINSKPAPEAKTTETVVQRIIEKLDKKYAIIVNHKIEVPIGAGFGTSAGGALTTGLALKEALALPLTYNEIGKIAHIAEILCQTGLGTVSSLTSTGGCVLVVEPGAPGTCVIDRLPIRPDYVVIAGFFSSTPKKTILSAPEKKREVNRWGKKTLEAILSEPTLENFLASCWEFAQKTGMATEHVRNLVKISEKAGAVGAAQNMIGEAVHAVALEENAPEVVEAFKNNLPPENVLVARIDFQGARLIGE
jgi:pantoate kinase